MELQTVAWETSWWIQAHRWILNDVATARCRCTVLYAWPVQASQRTASAGPNKLYIQVPRLVEDMWGLFDKGVYYQPTTHHASANATPWTFLEHLQHMPWYTDKVEEASIIMVDDYCYKMWAIAQTHSLKDRVRNPEDADETPMYILMKLYKQLIESELFQVCPKAAPAYVQAALQCPEHICNGICTSQDLILI